MHQKGVGAEQAEPMDVVDCRGRGVVGEAGNWGGRWAWKVVCGAGKGGKCLLSQWWDWRHWGPKEEG